jgi:hypothetical protein
MFLPSFLQSRHKRLKQPAFINVRAVPEYTIEIPAKLIQSLVIATAAHYDIKCRAQLQPSGFVYELNIMVQSERAHGVCLESAMFQRKFSSAEVYMLIEIAGNTPPLTLNDASEMLEFRDILKEMSDKSEKQLHRFWLTT